MDFSSLPRTRAACALALGILTMQASGQEFPVRPVRIISAYPPGGGPDIASRIIATTMTPYLGQQVIVENRPGAGGTLGANLVAKSPADGYTLLATDHAAAIYARVLYRELAYDPVKDLTMVTPLLKVPFVLVAGPSLAAGTLRELVAEAKASPGKIQYGHPGQGTVHHLTMELFSQRAGIEMQAVAYKGTATLVQEIAGGQIAAGITGHVTTAGLVKAGKLRPIAVSSKDRWTVYPSVPAMSEMVPGFEGYTYVSLFAPSGVPRAIMTRVNAEVTRALRNPEVAKKYDEVGFEPAPATLEESAQLTQKELATWPDVVRRLRITLD